MMTAYVGNPAGRLLDFELELTSATESPVVFGRTTFGLLAARVAPCMSPFDGGGRIINSRGDLNEEGAHLRRAKWIDQSAKGRWAGLAILDHPGNSNHPTTWHCRNDGWAGASFCADGEYVLRPRERLSQISSRAARGSFSGCPRSAALPCLRQRAGSTTGPSKAKAMNSKESTSLSSADTAMTRRDFLRATVAGTATIAGFSLLPAVSGAESPANRVVVGVMGTSRNSSGGDGRGTELAVGMASLPGVEVAYVCDVDERNGPKAADSVVTKAKQAVAPKCVRDFRRVLEDKNVDVLVIATPDHWHAPAAILACAAGKHVYVEKPCCHNPREGELLVAAARKYKRLVQHGTQRRSWPAIVEAVERLHSGAIGRVLFVKALYFGPRPTIGTGRPAAVPGWLDWDLWQGPAPARSFRDNIVHYNWHWFWHWGTGELGNNAVHFLDVCRWAIGADFPKVVTCSGGKYGFPSDDQETPDTTIANFDFGDVTICWEQRSWAPRTLKDPKYDIIFYGDKGVLTITGSGYEIEDLKGNAVAQGSGDGGNQTHLQNLIAAVRECGGKLNAEIEEGYKSALMCHLANIAWRNQQTVVWDLDRKLSKDRKAERLWGREYRKGWDPKV